MLLRGALAAALALALLPAGSTPAASSKSCAAPVPAGYRCYRARGLSFVHPAAWRPRHYRYDTSFSNLIVYLSNQNLHDPCRRSPSEIVCHPPLKRLHRDGVLATWQGNGSPTFKPPHPNTRIAGLPARVSTGPPDEDCAYIGGRRSVDAVIPTAPQNFVSFSACLRGPDFRQAERDAHRLLASTRFVDR